MMKLIVFEDLYREEYPKLVGRLYQSLPTKEDAEDVAQDAFVGLWENRARVRHPRGYLWRSARNMLSSWHRDRRESLELKPDALPMDMPLDAGLMAEWALGLLSREQRRWMLAKYAGYTNEEIAEAKGCSLGAAKAFVNRAREKVRNAEGGFDV